MRRSRRRREVPWSADRRRPWRAGAFLRASRARWVLAAQRDAAGGRASNPRAGTTGASHPDETPSCSPYPRHERPGHRPRPAAPRASGAHHRGQLGRRAGGRAPVRRRGRPAGAPRPVADLAQRVIDAHELDAAPVAVDLTDRAGLTGPSPRPVRHSGNRCRCLQRRGRRVRPRSQVHPADFDRTVAVTFHARRERHPRGPPGLARLAWRDRGDRIAHDAGAAADVVVLRCVNTRCAASSTASPSKSASSAPACGSRRCTRAHRHALRPGLQRHDATAARGARRLCLRRRLAQALVEVAVRPRAEVMLGGETRLLAAMFALARPSAELVLLLVDRWYRSGDRPANLPGSLWVSSAAAAVQRRHPRARQPAGAAAARPADAAAGRHAAAPRAAPGDRRPPCCVATLDAAPPRPRASAPAGGPGRRGVRAAADGRTRRSLSCAGGGRRGLSARGRRRRPTTRTRSS